MISTMALDGLGVTSGTAKNNINIIKNAISTVLFC